MQKRYLDLVRQLTAKYFDARETRVFLFGSAVRGEFFHDLDLGFTGEVDRARLGNLQEDLEESTLPYKVDLIDFNSVDEGFREHVFKEKILWLN
jgi:predicted nucleotidyltransferase